LKCTEGRHMKTSDIATELDSAFAAARVNALMGGVVMGDTVDTLHVIHKALKTKYAAGELTDEQFTKKSRELLEMLGSAVVSLYIQQNMGERND
ncbi:MAG: hypothetical protein WB496_15375, partial [Pseudolabrys sp.]